MPDLKTDEIVTQKHKRAFIQYGGPRPNNPVAYQGQDAQYMSIDGVSNPELGGIDPIWTHDPTRIGSYRLVGRSYSPADLASANLKIREKHGSIPRHLLKIGCSFNLYEPTGMCEDLSDFLHGWSDYVLVYSQAIVSDKDLGTRTSFDADDVIEDGLSLILSSIYPVGAISFGEDAASEVDREVIDVVYGPTKMCETCSFGDEWVYAVTAPSGAGSPGLPAECIYRLSGVVGQMNISGIGATETPLAIDVVGYYLVILGADAYYVSEINKNTGVPGTFTKVSSGFVAAGSPNDMYVAGSREIYFCGDGGYVYKSTDITTGVTVLVAGDATTENLKRIDGLENTIIAVGENGAIIKSTNRGKSFGTTVDSPVDTLTFGAVEVLDDKRYWLGTLGFAHVYYTLDGGETYTELAFSGYGSGNITDIYFATQEVGWICHQTASVTAVLLGTWNGGRDWTKKTPRITNWPTFDKAGRVACPSTDDPGWCSNSLAVAGLAGNGVDGILLVGTASKV